MDQIRRGLGSKSEAYKRYLRTLLRESAVTLPAGELQAAFARETDPAMVEHLAAALVARTERGAGRPRRCRPWRSGRWRTAIRPCAPPRSGPCGAPARSRTPGDMYERLVRDPSPEVRKEAATNLVEDNLEVYGGHDGPATDAAVAAAAASTDPQGDGADPRQPDDRGDERRLGAQARVACCAATRRRCARRRRTALGGVPASEMASARETLLGMYRGEKDPGGAQGMLESIARLGFAGAVPELQQLRERGPQPGARNRRVDPGAQHEPSGVEPDPEGEAAAAAGSMTASTPRGRQNRPERNNDA